MRRRRHAPIQRSNSHTGDRGGGHRGRRHGRAEAISRTRSGELDLIRRWQEDKDPLARNILTMDQQPLVSAIARSYRRYWADSDDLRQEGNVGLLEAIDRFDSSRGTPLVAYARPWVRAAILRFLADNVRLVRVGRSRGERRIFFRLNETQRLLCVQGVEPTPEVLAARIRTDPEEVESMAWRLSHTDLSLDESLDESPLGLAANGVESHVVRSELCAAIREAVSDVLASLEPRQAEILRSRLLVSDPCTLQELGDRFGVSRERVRQIEETSLERLRARVRAQLPDPDLWESDPPGGR